VIEALVSDQVGADETPRPGLLVALSGGPDSVALLLAGRTWAKSRPATLEAAHLNHQLRGDAALADEDFCRELCARLDIRLHVHRADPRPLARQRGLGLEEAGRHLRRRFLARLLDERPDLTCAATGHHRDDQTETVLLRLFRGTGLDGLRGIAPAHGRVIHPLLGVSRREIVSFLESQEQVYRIDATNETGEATRSRVRRELLPLARDIFGPGADRGPARLAEVAAADAALIDKLARQAFQRITADDGQGLSLAVEPLLALDPALARRVVRLVFQQEDGFARDLGLRHVDGVLTWLGRGQSGSSLDLPGGWHAVREFDRVRFLPGSAPATAGTGPLAEANLPPTGDREFRLHVEPGADSGPGPLADRTESPSRRNTTGWRLECPTTAIRGELRLRPWREGDRLEMLGLGGHKKVSDLLRERRIGVTARRGVLVVEDEAGLLWVVGLARAERTRLLPSTRRTVTIAVEPSGERNLAPENGKGRSA